MAEISIELVRGALARGYCAPGNQHKGLDSHLLNVQADEIMKLIERLAEQMVPGEAFFESAAPTPADIRAYAYDIVIRAGQGGWSDFHARVADVANNIEHGFKVAPIETMTVKLDIDTSSVEAVEARIKSAVTRIAAARAEMAEVRKEAEEFGGRTAWRREAWNDLKACMIRVLNQQIDNPHLGMFVLDLNKRQLENVRAFVGSFVFDPDMP